jgi:hypothetical protein
VPTTVPSWVTGVVCVAATVSVMPQAGAAGFAKPKSSSLAPVGVIMMLPGLRSRLTIPARWRFIERIGNLRTELQDLLKRQRTLLKALEESLAFDTLHDEKVHTVLLANVVERANVRMVETGDGFGFALEALLTYGIGRKMWRKNLDRYNALQPRIPCAIHLTHPARTDRLQDLIGPTSCSRGQC